MATFASLARTLQLKFSAEHLLHVQVKKPRPLSPSHLRRAHSLNHASSNTTHARSVLPDSKMATSLVAGSLPLLTSTSPSSTSPSCGVQPQLKSLLNPLASSPYSSHSHLHSSQAGLVTVPLNGLVVSSSRISPASLSPHSPSGDSQSLIEAESGRGKMIRKSPLSVAKFPHDSLREEPAHEEVPAIKTLVTSCPFPSNGVTSRPTAPTAVESFDRARSSNHPPISHSAGGSPSSQYNRVTNRAKPFLMSNSHPDVFTRVGSDVHILADNRAQSCDDFFPTGRPQPATLTSLSALHHTGSSLVEPTSEFAREKIDTLSQHMWDALESKVTSFPERFENPFLTGFKRILKVMAPIFDISPAQHRSIRSMAVVDTVPNAVGTASLTEGAMMQHDLDFDLTDSAPKLSFGSPTAGFVTLLFQVLLKGASSCGNSAHLKLIGRVFNLMDPTESNQYHSLAHSLCTDPCEEANILQKLPPHPNIVSLLSFQQRSSESFAMHIRDLDPDDRSTAYRMAPMAHCLFLTPYKKTLAEYYSEQCSARSPFGVSEDKSLSIISQMLLGVAHLESNHIVHCAISPETVVVGDNGRGLMLTDFSHAIDLKLQDRDLQTDLLTRVCSLATDGRSLAPEIVQKLRCLHGSEHTHGDAPRDLSAIDDLEDLFSRNDSYAVGCVMYTLLGKSNFREDTENKCSSGSDLSSLSPRFKRILANLVSVKHEDRMPALEAAICCLVLLFGPNSEDIHSLEDCHRWIFSECMEFYMGPVLRGRSEEYASERSKLRYMYLTVADPERVWNACKYLNQM